MNFKFFLGNENVKNQISALLASSRLPHAIIIEGEEGIGKRTLAREIAAALVCRSDGEKPCYSCSQCNKAQKQIHPDIYEYSAPGTANSFHVDTVRDVINDVYMAPNEADYKVYILGNAHCMNGSAQNALLKVLEEPPEYVVFILTAVSRTMMLETVLSRSVVFSLDSVDEKSGAEYIVSHSEDVDYNTALEAVCAFKGNIGKAAESISGGKMQKIIESVNNIGTAITATNEYELMKSLSVFGKDRGELVTALSMLKTVFRDALVYNKTGECLSGRKELVSLLRNKYTDSKLLALYNKSDDIIEMVQKNANNALLLTKICYTFRQAVGR